MHHPAPPLTALQKVLTPFLGCKKTPYLKDYFHELRWLDEVRTFFQGQNGLYPDPVTLSGIRDLVC